MNNQNNADGFHSPLLRENMTPAARKLRDAYARLPDAPLYQSEFGFFSLERWKEQGMPQDVPLQELFGFDPAGSFCLGRLGGTEAEFSPYFEEKVLEDRGEHELILDNVGRSKLVFKGRRQGFMPEYVDHPVKDMKTWVENCKWRMDPATPARREGLDKEMKKAQSAAGKGLMISQQVIGGYMFLRSVIGPADLLYKFHDDPELIRDCLRAWFDLCDAIIAEHQRFVTIDELFFDEDICFNHGPLISPAMIREFLFPHYRQLISNIRSRQLDKTRHLYFHVDSDGNAPSVIPIYQELGMDFMSPFEVASGCDVVELGRQYPDLGMAGGIDKRVLAKGKKDIDAMVDRILPAMRRRGGYIPTCDHGVPEEVSYENYLHYRKRCLEFA